MTWGDGSRKWGRDRYVTNATERSVLNVKCLTTAGKFIVLQPERSPPLPWRVIAAGIDGVICFTGQMIASSWFCWRLLADHLRVWRGAPHCANRNGNKYLSTARYPHFTFPHSDPLSAYLTLKYYHQTYSFKVTNLPICQKYHWYFI